MSKVDYCSQDNELTGFMPSEETIEQWLEKLRSNGVKEGSPVRLIGGCNAGKIVPFTFDREKLKVNDCGIGPSDYLGWFFRVSDEACVYPIYDEFENSMYEVETIGMKHCATGFKLKGVNYLLGYNISGGEISQFLSDESNGLQYIDCTDGCSEWLENKGGIGSKLYGFYKLNDLWAWLEQNY
jgi:hypothetical protein